MFAASKTASASGGYQISRSLRFNSADSTYLNRTPASASNQKTWTWSGWVKKTRIIGSGNRMGLFGVGPQSAGSGYFCFSFANDASGSGDSLLLDRSGVAGPTSTALYRDVSAWYHVVLAVNTTLASSRVRIYVNGTEITAWSASLDSVWPQNVDTLCNSTNQHRIGQFYQNSEYFDGYITEINFIDGQQLTPSAFGETNAQTGVWQPKAYSGSYGTNGFYLNFSDNSNTTAATLGKDYSGNGNNWTPNNFSVTAGAGNDSLVDSPTSYGTDTGAGGTVRGNYATLNPLKSNSPTQISNGNLSIASAGASYTTGVSTISPSSGNYYMEMTCEGANTDRPWAIGLVSSNAANSVQALGTGTFTVGNGSGSTVNYYVNASLTSTLSTAAAWVAGDVISLAWDANSTTGKFWVGRNGVWYPSTNGGTAASNADVAAGNFPTFTIAYVGNTDPLVFPAFFNYGTLATASVNFGQRPFAYTAPSGFKALCTQNLPTPTIGATTATQAGKFFNPVLYTGDRTSRTISVGFQPDWVWVKARNAADDHYLMNAVVGTGKYLSSNSTAAETTNAASLTAYTSDGFSIGNTGTTNETARTYVAWNWKASGSTVSNTSGTITSTVSANTTSGFSVVTYTGTGANATIGHGLGVAPSMIISKSRSNALDWDVYHSALGPNYWLRLNSTIAAVNNSAMWRNVSPTSTVWSIGTDTENNTNGATYVAYCFAEVAGYSKFGSYTGNGSADGVFVYTGFRPAYVLIKSSGTGDSWLVLDAARDTYNVAQRYLIPNASDAEGTAAILDFVSNGFKLRFTGSSANSSGLNYIYACFASNPLKYSLAR
jgi:hypothetical protein